MVAQNQSGTEYYNNESQLSTCAAKTKVSLSHSDLGQHLLSRSSYGGQFLKGNSQVEDSFNDYQKQNMIYNNKEQKFTNSRNSYNNTRSNSHNTSCLFKSLNRFNHRLQKDGRSTDIFLTYGIISKEQQREIEASNKGISQVNSQLQSLDNIHFANKRYRRSTMSKQFNKGTLFNSLTSSSNTISFKDNEDLISQLNQERKKARMQETSLSNHQLLLFLFCQKISEVFQQKYQNVISNVDTIDDQIQQQNESQMPWAVDNTTTINDESAITLNQSLSTFGISQDQSNTITIHNIETPSQQIISRKHTNQDSSLSPQMKDDISHLDKIIQKKSINKDLLAQNLKLGILRQQLAKKKERLQKEEKKLKRTQNERELLNRTYDLIQQVKHQIMITEQKDNSANNNQKFLKQQPCIKQKSREKMERSELKNLVNVDEEIVQAYREDDVDARMKMKQNALLHCIKQSELQSQDQSHRNFQIWNEAIHQNIMEEIAQEKPTPDNSQNKTSFFINDSYACEDESAWTYMRRNNTKIQDLQHKLQILDKQFRKKTTQILNKNDEVRQFHYFKEKAKSEIAEKLRLFYLRESMTNQHEIEKLQSDNKRLKYDHQRLLAIQNSKNPSLK